MGPRSVAPAGPAKQHMDKLVESLAPSLDERVRDLLSGLPERRRLALALRFGLLGGRPCSFAVVGKRLGLSRQRAHQIVRTALASLRRRQARVRWAAQPVFDALESLGGIASLPALVAEVYRRVPVRHGAAEDLVHLLLCLDSRVAQARHRPVGVWALRSLPVEAVPRIHRFCTLALKDARMGLTRQQLVDAAVEYLGDPRIERAFVAAAVDLCPSLNNAYGGRYYGRTNLDLDKLALVVETLQRAGRPLHFKTIAALVNSGSRVRWSAHTLHQFLFRETQVFVRTGPGTYGLRDWTISTEDGVRHPAAAD